MAETNEYMRELSPREVVIYMDDRIIIAVYVGEISDATLIMASTDPKLTAALIAWMDSNDMIECDADVMKVRLAADAAAAAIRAGDEGADVLAVPLTSIRKSVYDALRRRAEKKNSLSGSTDE